MTIYTYVDIVAIETGHFNTFHNRKQLLFLVNYLLSGLVMVWMKQKRNFIGYT